MPNEPKDLVEIIKNNPGCVAEIDNDCWSLFKQDPYEDRPDFKTFEDLIQKIITKKRKPQTVEFSDQSYLEILNKNNN